MPLKKHENEIRKKYVSPKLESVKIQTSRTHLAQEFSDTHCTTHKHAQGTFDCEF